MYVAFGWLSALSFAMWLALCCVDTYLAQYKNNIYLSTAVTPFKIYIYRNESILKHETIKNVTHTWHPRKNDKNSRVAYLHYATFLAGAITVFMYNRKTCLVTYCRNKIDAAIKCIEACTGFKITAENASVAMFQYWRILRETLGNFFATVKQADNGQNTNLSLLRRLKELVQDRKALGQILFAALEQNKNIRRQFQLEVVAKNRLLRYVQDTQNMIKDNKLRYVDFQQLYLTTAKENNILKNSIKRLKKDKDETEKKMLELLNIVYRSRNNDLKAYCTRFLVHSKKNLLNSDVNAEIHKFLQKSKPLIDDNPLSVNSDVVSPRITEILEDDGNFTSFGSSGPRLRGLPGEFVWTAKNKDGIIEKLYEYDCETDLDNGDTIRRIREYSVYHDKDCLLEQTNLAASIPTCPSLSASATRLRLDIKSFSSQGFLTKILVRNIPLRLPSTAKKPPLPYTTSDL